MTVRKARLTDLETLLTFEQGIIKAERPFDSTLGPDPLHYYDLGALIQANDAMVVVAEIAEQVVGSGYATIKPAKPYLHHEQYSYLGFMYTHPGYRGRGINRAIIDVLKKWSYDQGLKEIRLTVYEGNFSAIKAYEKTGFEKHLIEMRLNTNTP